MRRSERATLTAWLVMFFFVFLTAAIWTSDVFATSAKLALEATVFGILAACVAWTR